MKHDWKFLLDRSIESIDNFIFKTWHDMKVTNNNNNSFIYIYLKLSCIILIFEIIILSFKVKEKEKENYIEEFFIISLIKKNIYLSLSSVIIKNMDKIMEWIL